MNMPLTGRPIGLDGIPAAVTALSLVDGENGVLVIAGLPVERLAESLRFEAVAARLWRIADPRAEAVEAAAFGRLRAAAFAEALQICPSLVRLGPVEGLRAALAALDIPDGPGAAAAIVAAVPVLLATLEALRAGRTPLAPDPALGHAADTLRMLRGAPPSPAEARARAQEQLARLDPAVRRLDAPARYPVALDANLAELKARVMAAARGAS